MWCYVDSTHHDVGLGGVGWPEGKSPKKKHARRPAWSKRQPVLALWIAVLWRWWPRITKATDGPEKTDVFSGWHGERTRNGDRIGIWGVVGNIWYLWESLSFFPTWIEDQGIKIDMCICIYIYISMFRVKARDRRSGEAMPWRRSWCFGLKESGSSERRGTSAGSTASFQAFWSSPRNRDPACSAGWDATKGQKTRDFWRIPLMV